MYNMEARSVEMPSSLSQNFTYKKRRKHPNMSEMVITQISSRLGIEHTALRERNQGEIRRISSFVLDESSLRSLVEAPANFRWTKRNFAAISAELRIHRSVISFCWYFASAKMRTGEILPGQKIRIGEISATRKVRKRPTNNFLHALYPLTTSKMQNMLFQLKNSPLKDYCNVSLRVTH